MQVQVNRYYLDYVEAYHVDVNGNLRMHPIMIGYYSSIQQALGNVNIYWHLAAPNEDLQVIINDYTDENGKREFYTH